jgi:tetratricopeptide (TPR) repeat protein
MDSGDDTFIDRNTAIRGRIGNYRILKELSNTGGFGKVYLGKHIVFTDQAPVAIKVLRSHLTSSKEKERFLQEAHFLKMLTHPSILPIIEAGIQGEMPYLVVEYASNGSLKDILQKRYPNLLSFEQVLTILRQVGKALHYAHQQKVVHRDLKPDNILFDTEGKVLLADFGIATILEKTGLVDTAGTPPYMAPEQFKGKVSRRSDQYALGCIAYELVTGRRVFSLPKDATWYAWADKHINEKPVSPISYNSHLSTHFEQVILKALSKELNDRHPDVLTFIAELKTKEEWLADGNAYYEALAYEDAFEVYEYVIHLDPFCASGYTGEGNALYSLSRYKEALNCYEQAIQLDPDNIISWRKKGNILTLFERLEEAKQAHERAEQLEAEYTCIRDTVVQELVRDNLGENVRCALESIERCLGRLRCSDIKVQPCTFTSKINFPFILEKNEKKLLVNINDMEFVEITKWKNNRLFDVIIEHFLKDYLGESLVRIRRNKDD